MERHFEPSVGRRTLLRALSGIGMGVALSACAPSRPNDAATPNPGNAPAAGGTPAPAATLASAQSPVAVASASAAPAPAPGVSPVAVSQPSPVSGAAPLPMGSPTVGGPPPTIVGAPSQGPAPQPNAVGGFPVEGSASPIASPAASPGAVQAASPVAASGTPTPTPAATVLITADRRFDPPQVTIGRGQAVLWRNVGRSPQTVTCDPARVTDKSKVILPPGAQPFDSGVINSATSFSYTFDTPGDYQYVSLPFESQNMTGRVTVQG
ncbi:MAG TPA: plastocyanin/azurin family copper-binding protein [Chloroflexota bacterium]|nr:plastocyanin/azurin family copper-binding protein [Chloroflexota bacterium]